MQKPIIPTLILFLSLFLTDAKGQEASILVPSDTNYLSVYSPQFPAPDSSEPELKRWNTPVHRFVNRNKNLSRFVIAPVALSAIWTSTYYNIDQPWRDEIPNEKSPFKESVSAWAEPLGRGATIQPMFGAFMAYGLVAKDKRARKTAVIGLATYYLNDGVTSNLKRTFGRIRPNSAELKDNWFAGEPNRSFPSSHTSTAFAAATVLSTMYREKKWVAPIAYTAATAVGFSRLYHNNHWASDVLAGAVVGFASAKFTIWAYDWLEQKLIKKRNMAVVPQVGPGNYGVSVMIGL